MEEDMFRMVAEMKKMKKKAGGGDGKDDVLLDMMGRMADSYTKVKVGSAELAARCVELEGKNKTLQRRVEELEGKQGGDGREEKVPEKRERKSRFSKIEDRDEERDRERERDRDRDRERDGDRDRDRDRDRERDRSSRGDRSVSGAAPVPPPSLMAMPPRGDHKSNLSPFQIRLECQWCVCRRAVAAADV
jgi:hypothetical protein